MKRVWIVEKADSAGEFQPTGATYFQTREGAAASAELRRCDANKAGQEVRYRVMQYYRSENKA